METADNHEVIQLRRTFGVFVSVGALVGLWTARWTLPYSDRDTNPLDFATFLKALAVATGCFSGLGIGAAAWMFLVGRNRKWHIVSRALGSEDGSRALNRALSWLHDRACR